MEPGVHQDDTQDDVEVWNVCFDMYLDFKDQIIWLWKDQAYLRKRVMLQFSDCLEPYFNVVVISLVHLLIWIILDVFFFHDLQIFLFLLSVLLNIWSIWW